MKLVHTIRAQCFLGVCVKYLSAPEYVHVDGSDRDSSSPKFLKKTLLDNRRSLCTQDLLHHHSQPEWIDCFVRSLVVGSVGRSPVHFTSLRFGSACGCSGALSFEGLLESLEGFQQLCRNQLVVLLGKYRERELLDSLQCHALGWTSLGHWPRPNVRFMNPTSLLSVIKLHRKSLPRFGHDVPWQPGAKQSKTNTPTHTHVHNSNSNSNSSNGGIQMRQLEQTMLAALH